MRPFIFLFIALVTASAFAAEPAFLYDTDAQAIPDFSPNSTAFVACPGGVCSILAPRPARVVTLEPVSRQTVVVRTYRSGPIRAWANRRPVRSWIRTRPIRRVVGGLCR